MTYANQPGIQASSQNPAMPFGVTLERVFRILRDHRKVFLGLAVPPAVAMILLYGAMSALMFANLRPFLSKSSGPLAAFDAQFAIMRIMFPSILVAMVPMLVVFAFYLAGSFHAANKIDNGTGSRVAESFAAAWASLGRSILLLIWIYFRAFGAVLLIEVVFFALSGWLGLKGSIQNMPTAAFAVLPLVWLLFIAAYVYGVFVALRMSLAFPALMEEGLTAGEAVRRSNTLTHGSKMRIFLLLLVIYAIAMACFMVIYFVGLVIFGIGAFVMAASQTHPSGPWVIIAVAVAGLAFACFLYFWTALMYGSLVVTFSVVYHDQRRRLDPPIAAQLPAARVHLPPGTQPA
jgi:hypothetical protein